MKNLSTRTIVISSLVFFSIAGAAYSLITPKLYSSKSQVALFRLKIENSDSGSDESRNRWIWIRDGLNLKSAVVTDSIIEKIAQTEPSAKEMAPKFANTQLFYDHLKKYIDVQFTGADENNFIVEVKAPNPQFAFQLNTLVFERIKYLATVADKKNFEQLVSEIKIKQQDLKSDKESFAFYEDKIRKMTFNHIVEQKQRETAFEIISAPTLNDQPIWPRFKSIFTLSFLFGLVFGFGADFVLKNMTREK